MEREQIGDQEARLFLQVRSNDSKAEAQQPVIRLQSNGYNSLLYFRNALYFGQMPRIYTTKWVRVETLKKGIGPNWIVSYFIEEKG